MPTIIITKTKIATMFATGNSRNAAPAEKHTAEALIVVRNSVRKNMKNFPTSNWNPSQQHAGNFET